MLEHGGFIATDDSTPRREIKSLSGMQDEMDLANAAFEKAHLVEAGRAMISRAREAFVVAKEANRKRLNSPPALAPVPSASPEIVKLHTDMGEAVKFQPKVMAGLEKLVKCASKRKLRANPSSGTTANKDSPGENLNMVFSGESGTFKTTSARKLTKALFNQGLLKKETFIEVAKDVSLHDALANALKNSSLKKLQNVAEYVAGLFKAAEGGVLFFDEIQEHSHASFTAPLLTALGRYEGRILVIIAGYTDNVNKWFKDSDPGMAGRFPITNRVRFEKLSIATLSNLAIQRLHAKGHTLHESANGAMRNCMDQIYNSDRPTNARGVNSAVDEIVSNHDVRDDIDPFDMCITAEPINEAITNMTTNATTSAGDNSSTVSTSVQPAPIAVPDIDSRKRPANSAASPAHDLQPGKRPAVAAAEAPATAAAGELVSPQTASPGGGEVITATSAAIATALKGLYPDTVKGEARRTVLQALSASSQYHSAWELIPKAERNKALGGENGKSHSTQVNKILNDAVNQAWPDKLKQTNLSKMKGLGWTWHDSSCDCKKSEQCGSE